MLRPSDVTLGEAARTLGVSADTLRRWDRAGKLQDDARRAQPAAACPSSEVRRLGGRARAARDRRHALGAQPVPRRRALGRGRRGDGDGRDRGGPAPGHRGDHPRRGRGARARPGVEADGDGEGDVGDGRPGRRMSRRVAAVRVSSRLATRGLRRRRRAASSELERLRRVVAERGVRGLRRRLRRRRRGISFAGSDELAAQIRQGARRDVFASANTSLPGRSSTRTAWSRSRSVSPPTGSCSRCRRTREIGSLDDLAERRGRRSSIGAEGVPVGDYTREVLDRLPAAERGGDPRQRPLRGARGEGDRRQARRQGAADAGFVYVTDVEAAGERRCARSSCPAALAARRRLRRGGRHGRPTTPSSRDEFVDGLLDGAGAEALREAGFLPPAGDGVSARAFAAPSCVGAAGPGARLPDRAGGRRSSSTAGPAS